MTKNYAEALHQADTLFDYGGLPEQLVALGYRAGLQDAVQALNEAGAVQPSTEGSRRLYVIVRDKLSAIARKFEARAKELKV